MRKLFTLTLALLASFSLWAAEETNEGTYSTQVISADGKTSTWTFITPSSQVTVPTGETKDVDFIYAPSSSSKMKFSSSNGFSWSGESSGYVYVPAGGAGTISMTVKSSSDSRYLQLYVSGSAAADSKRLWSKYNETATSDGKKGPQSFAFTSSDLTTKGDSTFLHFKDNNTEMKIATISITLTTGTYAKCNAPTNELTLSSDAAATVYEGDEITFSTTGGNGGAITLEGSDSESITDSVWVATVGEHTFTASQEKNGNICAQEDELVINVLAADAVEECTISGPTAAYKNNQVTYTATAENASDYRWKIDGAIQPGASTATFNYTPTVNGTYSIVCEARNTFNAEGVWIASDPISLTVSSVSGTLIAATAETSGSNIDKNITATGVIGGTVHQKTQKNAKLGSEGHYFSLTLASGSFQDGDTVKVVVTPEYNSDKETYSAPAQLKISTTVGNTNLIGESETKTIDPASSADLYFDIVLSEGASTIYLARDGSICKQNPIVKSIAVVRPKEIKSVTETLSNVKIDGEAISSANLTTLLADESLDIAESYLNAPEVKFYKNIRTTYEDDTYSDKLDSIVVTSTTEAGKWQAQATINAIEYTITMAKTPSYSVTYKLGSRTLGSELVVANGNPAEYEDYQVIDNNGLSTFVGWYNNADLAEEHKVANMSAEVISAAAIYYAKFNIKYASSINIEQWILDNGAGKGSSTKTDALIAEMNSHNYSTNIEWSNTSKEEIELDSLDDGKTSRNEPYLGLKVKKSGKLINFRLKEGEYVKVKFGQVSTTPKVAINGGDYTTMTITDNVYTYNATGEDLVSIYIDVAQKAVVYKQIMINEDIQDVTLPDTPTSIYNTADEIKAVKFIENGQLFIRRGNKVFDATGQMVK